MQKAKAQSSVEYLTITAFMLVIIVVIFVLSFITTDQNIKTRQTSESLERLVQTADLVYAMGKGNVLFAEVIWPNEVSSISAWYICKTNAELAGCTGTGAPETSCGTNTDCIKYSAIKLSSSGLGSDLIYPSKGKLSIKDPGTGCTASDGFLAKGVKYEIKVTGTDTDIQLERYCPGSGPASGCTDYETRNCPLQLGVCIGAQETCAEGAWPGCNAATYGALYETAEESCTDLSDNDCDGKTDCVDATDCGGDPACGGAAAMLVAYYKADGNAADSSGTGNNGAWFGTPAYQPGVSGQAFDFPGNITTGNPIIDGLKVDGNRCQTNFIGTWNNKPNSDPNLIGYWKFDAQEDDYNNIRAFDYSGNNNHGQYINGADNNSQGKWDTNATRFDAVTSNIKLGDPPLLEGMTQLTVSMWIYPIQNTKDLDLLVKGAHSIAQPFVFFYDEAITDHYGLLITDTGGATTGFKYSSAIPVINTWTHLAVTFKGDVNGNVLIYVNGALDANYSYPLVSDIKSTAANWTIGCDDGPCGSKAASGFIDEVKMWNRTLTPAEISLDYNLSKRNFRTCSQDWNIINVADANYYANVLVRDDVGNSDFNASYNNFRVNPSGEPPLNCGDTITTDTTMTEDLLGCTNNGITIGAEDVNLNCNGFTIDGNDTQSSNGVYTEYAGTTVKNCVVSDFGNGINVQAADNATISNNTTFSNITTGIRMFYTSNFSLVNDNNSYNNSYNLFVYTDHNITIKNNNLHDGNYGVWSTQDANLIAYSNKIYDNNVGWYLEDDAILYKNLIYNNYFSNAIHDFITTNPPGASSNHTNVYLPAPNGGHTMDWNTSNQTGTRIFGEGTNIGGNYYTNPDLNGYSNTCIDSQADGFCDSPYDVVDNNSCTIAASDCSINTDYLPLSDEYGAETDSCTCPASGWWNIINGDICTLATSCTLTSGGLHIIDGNLTILNTKQLTIPSTYHAIIEKGEKLYIEKGGKIVINK